MYAVQYQFRSKVAPRLQWNANSGYCGETSFICAGLNFGQYCSQYTARALASPGMDQHHSKSQLLLGAKNDVAAAKKMRLSASEYVGGTDANTPDFIAWAKLNLMQGHVPIIGVLNNYFALQQPTPQGLETGDGGYDHIVPVLGFASDWPLKKDAYRYYPSDVITFSDNGLYGPVGDPEHYPFLFSYDAAPFQGTQVEANNPTGFPIYMLHHKPPNYGIAITGVEHDDSDAIIPVILRCNKDREPKMERGSNTPPTPWHIQLTAKVDLPDQTKAYNLYRYDHFDSVPTGGFNDAPSNAVQTWHIPAGTGQITTNHPKSPDTVSRSGPTVVVTHDAMSSDTVVFRAVQA